MSKTKKIIFTCSIILNIFGFIGLAFELNTNQVGVLTEDVNVGDFFNRDSVLFILPKGLTVRNMSPQGLGAIDQLEPHRFYIVVSTNDNQIVNYNIRKDTLYFTDNMYSMDFIGHMK